jgi:hypothetical protein
MGPLKSNWTKSCTLDWTPEERDEKCKSVCGSCVLIETLLISLTFLTTLMLKHLEAIKETIDPNYMFDYFKCIGNNRMKSSVDNEPSTEVSFEPLGEAETGVY